MRLVSATKEEQEQAEFTQCVVGLLIFFWCFNMKLLIVSSVLIISGLAVLDGGLIFINTNKKWIWWASIFTGLFYAIKIANLKFK